MLTPLEWQSRFQQQARWTEQVRRFLFDNLGLSQAHRGVEVGCGTGAAAGDFMPPGGPHLQGIDLRLDFLRLARRQVPSLRLAQADALRLPFAPAVFDFAFCHYFLLWVKDPLLALLEMRRVTRSGGVVLALAEPDYGGRIDYPSELVTLGRRQAESLRRQGSAIEIGRSLAALLQAAGLHNVRSGVLGGQWGAPPSQAEIRSEWQVLSSDLAGAVTPTELAEYQKQDAAAWNSGVRILYIPTFYAFGYVQ
jgi:SAM-dependent methyltransferase